MVTFPFILFSSTNSPSGFGAEKLGAICPIVTN